MLKIMIDGWEMPKIINQNPDVYEQLRVAGEKIGKSLKPLDKVERSENGEAKTDYSNDFWAYITSADDLPVEVLNYVKWEHQPLLKMVKDDGASIHTRSVVDALKLHQVHLPDNALLKISEVEVQENCCSEHLNDKLKEGWRIIAVCPQSGQRRPDYVLGRNKQKESEI